VDRRLQILERLTSGISAPHIWRVEKLTVRRALRIIAECDRQSAGFVQLQIPQISHATIVTQTMMKRSSSDQARMQPRPPSKASPTLEHRNLSPAVLCGGGLPLERAP